jgi:hypothetical protein
MGWGDTPVSQLIYMVNKIPLLGAGEFLQRVGVSVLN